VLARLYLHNDLGAAVDAQLFSADRATCPLPTAGFSGHEGVPDFARAHGMCGFRDWFHYQNLTRNALPGPDGLLHVPDQLVHRSAAHAARGENAADPRARVRPLVPALGPRRLRRRRARAHRRGAGVRAACHGRARGDAARHRDAHVAGLAGHAGHPLLRHGPRAQPLQRSTASSARTSTRTP